MVVLTGTTYALCSTAMPTPVEPGAAIGCCSTLATRSGGTLAVKNKLKVGILAAVVSPVLLAPASPSSAAAETHDGQTVATLSTSTVTLASGDECDWWPWHGSTTGHGTTFARA
jgi:hypothetical protein